MPELTPETLRAWGPVVDAFSVKLAISLEAHADAWDRALEAHGRCEGECNNLRLRIEALEKAAHHILERSQRIARGEVWGTAFSHADYCIQVAEAALRKEKP